ncbi:DAK2 domain-containing protein [Herpetosiphon llansteffanensis]|uniref:DAK2 domain-containing protein n=1 Tax=Herpetosiphon llansteffanensis TaxID=2094568 RepID=UPI000D7B9390|nr:DAK2 domain-containing protein [Herpetosiphon llansteffanensis]
MSKALTDLFAEITNNLADERDSLNALDGVGDGDAGDNMVSNFETITNTLRQNEGQGSVDNALRAASHALRTSGKGPTAPMYANGLDQAANDLAGKTSFGVNDIMKLLGGLLGGVQNTPGVKQQGEGGILDGLVPGVTTFMQSRNNGKSTLEALMDGYKASQRGAYGTSQQGSGFGQFGNNDTSGKVDPGAAGASSLLGSLLQTLLANGLSAGRGEPSKTSGFEELFGGGRQQQQPPQQQQPQGGYGDALGGLGDLFGQLFGGGGGMFGGQPQQQQRPSSGGDDPKPRLRDQEVI